MQTYKELIIIYCCDLLYRLLSSTICYQKQPSKQDQLSCGVIKRNLDLAGKGVLPPKCPPLLMPLFVVDKQIHQGNVNFWLLP
jgi:hypothetical protein